MPQKSYWCCTIPRTKFKRAYHCIYEQNQEHEPFNSYLYGQEILLSTDNSVVSWVKKIKNPTGLVGRWLQEFGNLNFTITHRPGRKHSNADALSRNPCKVCLRQENGNEQEHYLLNSEVEMLELLLPVEKPK